MIGTKQQFLNRAAELARLRTLLQARKSILLYGPAGIGKSSLLQELRSERKPQDPQLLFSSGQLEPAPWLRHVTSFLVDDDARARPSARPGSKAASGRSEARGVVSGRSAKALRAILFKALSQGSFVLVVDPVGFVSLSFYKLLRDLERATQTPLVLVARSPHMEDIGYATHFAWPREQRLSLGPLPPEEAARLFELATQDLVPHPANWDSFRAQILDYARGNPGTLVTLATMAHQPSYWAQGTLKLHLLIVDFNLRGTSAAGVEP